jgi:ubiquinone/menaquinone biosynthesis C-methylase UbiE
MSDYKKGLPGDFNEPTRLPDSDKQAENWQKANQDWWEKNPMRYDWKNGLKPEEFSKEFFQEIDGRFFGKVREFLPWKSKPFDNLVDYESLKNKDVLEIGVGSGSVAQQLASSAKYFVGIDLTEYAVQSTSKRMEQFELAATIVHMDAEKLEFPDNSFDYIWTWGVIHHSSRTDKILKEMQRVLRPNGRALVMVYYRNWWNYWFCAGFLRGLMMGRLFKLGSIHSVMQEWWDGAIARFYTIDEWKQIVSENFDIKKTLICGGKPEMLPLPSGKLKLFFLSILPNWLGQFMATNLRMGTFLVTELEKKER